MPGNRVKRGCKSETGSVAEMDIQDAVAASERAFEEQIASLNVKEVEAACELRKELEEFARTAAEFADTFRSSFKTRACFRIDNWVVLHGSEYETDVAVAVHEWASVYAKNNKLPAPASSTAGEDSETWAVVLNCCGMNSELAYTIARMISGAMRKKHDEHAEESEDNNSEGEE